MCSSLAALLLYVASCIAFCWNAVAGYDCYIVLTLLSLHFCCSCPFNFPSNYFQLISAYFRNVFFSFVFSINSILIIVVLSLCTFDFLVFNCVQHRTKSYQIRHIDFSSKTNWMERWKRTATKKKAAAFSVRTRWAATSTFTSHAH